MVRNPVFFLKGWVGDPEEETYGGAQRPGGPEEWNPFNAGRFFLFARSVLNLAKILPTI